MRMKLVFCFCSFLLIGSDCCAMQDRSPSPKDLDLQYRTLDALTRGLSYMDKAIAEVNVDAVFCVRRVEEQLQAFLEFQPDVFKNIRCWVDSLRRRANRTANKGRTIIYKNDPTIEKDFGFLMSHSRKLIWYPSLSTSTNAIVEPKPCSETSFNGTFSNNCYRQLSGADAPTNGCNISSSCMRHYHDMRQREYSITHQVLFWELMEMRKCVERVSTQLRTEFCSNVMRDAEQAERRDFSVNYQDLFLEQIGLCGIWGFRDFYKPHWLKKILDWQLSSGCYNNYGEYNCEDDLLPKIHSRGKRTEIQLSDNCLAHKTGVALLALAANLRFEAEIIFASNGR